MKNIKSSEWKNLVQKALISEYKEQDELLSIFGDILEVQEGFAYKNLDEYTKALPSQLMGATFLIKKHKLKLIWNDLSETFFTIFKDEDLIVLKLLG